jgi:hypothetical protein
MSRYTTYITNDGGCPPGKLKVRRKGYTRADGSKVKGTSYCADDRGKPGRGPKTIPTPRKGALGGSGYTERSEQSRHRLLSKHVREYGYASTISSLQSRINLGRNTMSKRALRVFEKDKQWVQDKYGDKTTMATKKKATKKKASKKGASKGLKKARAIRGAMTKLGVSKTEANRLYDAGKLTPTGAKKKKAAKKKAAKKKAKKKTTKMSASRRRAVASALGGPKRKKKATKKKATKKKAPKKAPKKVAKKATKRKATKRKAKKATKKKGRLVTLEPSGKKILRVKKRPKCPKSRTASTAADRVRRGEPGRSGRPLANARWCRNFMNLDVAEKDLDS